MGLTRPDFISISQSPQVLNSEVLVSRHFQTSTGADGTTYLYPQGDTSVAPSGQMPASGFFFDSIERIDPDFDEDTLRVEDNLEEFALMNEADVAYWTREAKAMRGTDRAVLTHLNGTCLGDIALVPAPFLKVPKGVRGVADWYLLLADNPEHMKRIYAAQTEIAVENMRRLHAIVGDLLDVVVICGTDFGTQQSQFCSVAAFRDIWLPYYRQINGWIHEHTSWKTFKHSCGAVEPFIEAFIDSGFDILNPVQCSAAGMDPHVLKSRYGDRIAFWGGGINTQETLPFGTPEQVRAEALQRCEVFGKGGGFIFNAIHNIQARTPVANVAAMIAAVAEFNAAG